MSQHNHQPRHQNRLLEYSPENFKPINNKSRAHSNAADQASLRISLVLRTSTTIKNHLDRASAPLCRNLSSYDIGGEMGNSQATTPKSTKKVIRFRLASPSSTPVPEASEKLAWAVCEGLRAKGERTSCFNSLCVGCGVGAVSVVRVPRGFCGQCAGETEGRNIITNSRAKDEGKEKEGPTNSLAGPSTSQETDVLRTVVEDVGATSEGETCCSKQAAIGGRSQDPNPATETVQPRNRGGLSTRRKCKKLRLNFKKLCSNEECESCGDQGCGSMLVDGDGVTIRTCSDESLVLISMDQETAYESVVFNAAQIGSPTGLAHSTWPSKFMRASMREAEIADVEYKQASACTSAHLKPSIDTGEASDGENFVFSLSKPAGAESESAMKEPISSLANVHSTSGLPNSLSNHYSFSTATSNPISIPGRRPRHGDHISHLNHPPTTNPEAHHEIARTKYWRELLDLSPSLIESISPPCSLLVNSSLDSTLSFPQSLADSEFCNELVRTLSDVPENTENSTDVLTQVSSFSSPYFSDLPASLQTMELRRSEGLESKSPKDAPRPVITLPTSSNPCHTPTLITRSSHQSLGSEISFMPENHLREEYRSKLTRNLASTAIATMTSFPISPHSPTLTPSRTSHFLFNPTHFDEQILLRPHSHPHRTPSPPLAPCSSLVSSSASFHLEVHPALGGIDSTKPIRPRASTPGLRDSTSGRGGWSNESVSWSELTPQFSYAQDLESQNAVKFRGGDRKCNLIGKDGLVKKMVRKIKVQFENWVPMERVKSELIEKWVRKEYNLGFVIIGIERPLRIKAKRNVEGKTVVLIS